MKRRPKDYLLIGLKGLAMGAADAVPGVSGGTIAFISGIYEELIGTISNINLKLFKTLVNEGLLAFWKQANASFLAALLSGIVLSFVSFMRLAKYLIEYQPVLIWSFFFGLILASVYFVGRKISKWSISVLLSLVLGAFSAFFITTLPALGANQSAWFLFFAGALAICAMILPGISGSFILLILGAYKTLSDALHDFDLNKIGFMAMGALVGLLGFTRFLKWLFFHYHNLTLALLTGFIFGSLNKLWPWKLTQKVMEKSSGKILEFSDLSDFGTLSIYQQQSGDFESLQLILERSSWPAQYAVLNGGINPQIPSAILWMAVGFLLIFILEKLGSSKS